ncbi:UDP-N-acetylmuramoyl-L-alanyl-D-glutamate--2,6-diaminopimelate ligase [Mycoplasmatota bacterium WC44]
MRLKDIKQTFTHITQNSKMVTENSLFVSMNDKHLFEAIKNGAVAIISNNDMPLHVPVYETDPLMAYTNILKDMYDLSIDLIGITGTDGKTTTASIIQYLLTNDKCGSIGTNGIKYKDETIESKYTTPILEDTYDYLNTFEKEGLKTAVMEVSSEGILNNRINGLEYDVAIFTNLTHEHLNTHKTMDNYFSTKIQLFKQLKDDGIAIINIDDEYYPRFSSITLRKVLTYGVSDEADYQIKDIRNNGDHMTFTIKTSNKSHEIRTNLLGKYNAYNITAALITVSNRMDIYDAIKMVETIPEIEGRYFHMRNDSSIDLIVDFAHTPNALKNLLETVNENKRNNSILVVGAAGEKDKSKRSIMGEVATKNSDFVIFTSEDPKNEDEKEIVDQLLKEVTSENYIKIYDRKEAIKSAVKIARMNDTIIITGKGNEHHFNKNNKLTRHNDIEIAKEFLIKKGI